MCVVRGAGEGPFSVPGVRRRGDERSFWFWIAAICSAAPVSCHIQMFRPLPALHKMTKVDQPVCTVFTLRVATAVVSEHWATSNTRRVSYSKAEVLHSKHQQRKSKMKDINYIYCFTDSTFSSVFIHCW